VISSGAFCFHIIMRRDFRRAFTIPDPGEVIALNRNLDCIRGRREEWPAMKGEVCMEI